MTQFRLVNVKNKENGMMNRIPQLLAEKLVKEGTHVFVSKGATKHFFNRQFKIFSSEDALKNVDFSKKQKENFVTQEGNKVMGYRLRGFKKLTYEMPEDKVKAEEKKTWLENIVEKYCINPEDNTIKSSLLAKLAIFLGFFKNLSKKKSIPKTQTKELPLYQRYIMGYGKLPQTI